MSFEEVGQPCENRENTMGRKKQGENEDEDWRDAVASQGPPKIASEPPEA